MTATDPYKVLGVGKNSTEDDIKKAYRGLAKKFHPDKNKNEDAEEKFKEIGAAYDTLKDPVKKWDYDNKREGDEEKSKKAQEQAKNHANSKTTTNGSGFTNFKTHTNKNGTSFTFSSNGANFTFKSTPSSFDDADSSNKKKENTRKQSKPEPQFKHQRRTFDFTRPSWNKRWTEDSDEETMPNMFRFSFNQFSDPFEDVNNMFDDFFNGPAFFSGTYRDFLRINAGTPKRKTQPKTKLMDDMWDWSNPLFGKRDDEYEECGYNSDPEPEDISRSSIPCSFCGRPFRATYLKQHEEVCRRIFGGHKKHKDEMPSRTSKQNIYQDHSDEDERRSPSPPPRSHDWRQEHDDLQRNVRHARKAQAHKSNRTSHTPEVDSVNFVKCKWCGRKFSAIVAERHIPACGERTHTFGEPMHPPGTSTSRDFSSKIYKGKEYAKNIPKSNVTNDTPFRSQRDFRDEPFTTSSSGLHATPPPRRTSTFTRHVPRPAASTRRNGSASKTAMGGGVYTNPLRTGRRT